MSEKNTIPEMTDPLGKYWDQPKREAIDFVSDDIALMSELSFKMLSEYSTSYPSGIYEGKMWKSKLRSGEWVLKYFSKKNESEMNIISRKIQLK